MANDKAADPSNPNAHAGPTEPAGMSNGPLNGSNEVEGKGEQGEVNERASGIAAPSSNGEYAVPNLIPPVPNPDKLTPSPLSTLLEGENEGEWTSGHPEEIATHLETPRLKLRTTPPTQTPYNRKSNGHRPLAGKSTNGKVEDNTPPEPPPPTPAPPAPPYPE
ncbi:hypothetical protein PAXINDRAFT_21961 [Paxillus involutus ATCC 200175]|uniref:Uncharacterized protein n=1 Tax=Paxillus involutus ATCC 200175 TaxID=664439 RepID=A0A0C9SLN7_PAXIN|nr:hypothetical protein PAXINDRAFT_21961 [Paxillus involutus ATCC 200175]